MAGRGRPGVAPQTVKREQYAALIARGVASSVGRDPATVSREQRRARPKTGKLVADVRLREFVQCKLKRRWSPEQIV
jgi:IS30 family transposase